MRKLIKKVRIAADLSNFFSFSKSGLYYASRKECFAMVLLPSNSGV